jgi:phosphohistidine phosphatase
MRHAKSSHKNLNLNDHDRPLNTRGLNDAPRIHQELSRINFLPNLILVSSSTRTLETLSAMNFDSNEV